MLAAMAAIADADGACGSCRGADLCCGRDRGPDIAGAKTELLGSGELVLVSGVGGRGNTNVWVVRTRADGAGLRAASARVPPPLGHGRSWALRARRRGPAGSERRGKKKKKKKRNCPVVTGVGAKGGQDRTVSAQKCPV